MCTYFEQGQLVIDVRGREDHLLFGDGLQFPGSLLEDADHDHLERDWEQAADQHDQHHVVLQGEGEVDELGELELTLMKSLSQSAKPFVKGRYSAILPQ